MNKWQALENILNNQHENVPNEVWSDEEIVFHACHWNGYNFRFANSLLKSNKKFVLKIIKYWGYTLEYADENIKKDKKFILDAVKYNASVIKYIDPELRKNKIIHKGYWKNSWNLINRSISIHISILETQNQIEKKSKIISEAIDHYSL